MWVVRRIQCFYAIQTDDPIEKLEHGLEHFGRIQVHVISYDYALAITSSMVLDISADLVRIRSNSLNGGSSTFARRAYARWMALLLCSQSLLREPFGITGFFGASRPRIPIRMQGGAFDAQTQAPLMKFRCPVA